MRARCGHSSGTRYNCGAKRTRDSHTDMNQPRIDTAFAGPIPKAYEDFLVPLLFKPYAADLAKRLTGKAISDLLEVAAGTGVVTRALASAVAE